MDAININEALSRMAEAGDQPFRITFVRATGKEIGSIREAMCYYGAPNPRDRQAPTEGQKGQGRRRHKESGSIPLTEVGTRHLLTPLISHLLTFEGRKIYR
jgi:hypothetical protein